MGGDALQGTVTNVKKIKKDLNLNYSCVALEYCSYGEILTFSVIKESQMFLSFPFWKVVCQMT